MGFTAASICFYLQRHLSDLLRPERSGSRLGAGVHRGPGTAPLCSPLKGSHKQSNADLKAAMLEPLSELQRFGPRPQPHAAAAADQPQCIAGISGWRNVCVCARMPVCSILRCVFNVSMQQGGPCCRPPPTLKPHVRVFLSYRRAAVTHARGCCEVKGASGPTGFTPREGRTGFGSF